MKGVPSFRLHSVTDWSLKVQYRLQTFQVRTYFLICWWRIRGVSLCCSEGKFCLLEVRSALSLISIYLSMKESIQGKKSFNAHYAKWKERASGKQYVPYSHTMVGVYSFWKTIDGFIQLRKQLTAKKKQPPSRAMDEPDLRGVITRCLHWSTSFLRRRWPIYCLCSEARKGIQQEVEEIDPTRKFIGAFYSQFHKRKRSVLLKSRGVLWLVVDL